MGSVKCKWCGSEHPFIEVEKNTEGFWCDCCEGYTFFGEDSRRFLILAESKGNTTPISKPNKLLRKQISPLRYPGGKSKIIDILYGKLRKEQMNVFSEVFAGGASLGLSLLDAGTIDNLYLNDKDPAIAAFWRVCTSHPEVLFTSLTNTVLSEDLYFKCREKVLSGEGSDDELAVAQLIVNRCAFSGIALANPMRDITSRWNPTTLCKRIKRISEMKDKIIVSQMDYSDFIEDMWWKTNSTFFVDAPYIEKGHKLYNMFFEEKDHRNLAEILLSLYKEFPNTDILMTYDDDPLLYELYPEIQIEKLNRKFSVAN